MKERIRQLLHAKDFRPFTILMADGEKYLVRSRDHAFVPPGLGTYVLVVDDNDQATFLTALLISGVQVERDSADQLHQPS